MARYRFQFEAGHLYDGPTEITINDFIGEVEGEINNSLALTIEAHGGVLMKVKPTIEDRPKAKAKGRKAKPIKWPSQEGEK